MKLILFIASALAAVVATAGYQDWYIPYEGYEKEIFAVGFTVNKKTSAVASALNSTRVDIQDKLEECVENMELPVTAKNAFELAKTALTEAIYAEFQSELAAREIESLGASVETIFQLTNANRVDSSGAVISSGKLSDDVRKKMLAKKQSMMTNGASGGTDSTGGENAPVSITVTDFPYDDKEFEQRRSVDGKKSKMAIKGYKDLYEAKKSDSTDLSKSLAFTYGWIPITNGKDDDIVWKAWAGIDNRSLGVAGSESGDYQGGITIKGFNDGNRGGCNDTMNSLLTSEERQSADKHMILARYSDGESTELHWVTFGDRLGVNGDSTPPDDETLEYYIEDGKTNLQLYAWQEAKLAAGAEENPVPYIPYADGLDSLAWGAFNGFFSENIFETTKDGRIKLRGIGEEQGKVKVLAVTGGDSEDSSTLSGFAGDGVSIDFGIDQEGAPQSPLAQLHKFDSAPSPYGATGFNFADSLTNAGVRISDMSVPVRFINGGVAEIGYIPMGKVTGIPIEVKVPVDDKTIATNTEHGAFSENVASIYGSNEASQYDFPLMGKDHIEWKDITYFADGKAIDDATPPAGEKPQIKLKGWNDYDIGVFCNSLGEGGVYSLRGITLNSSTKTMYPDNIGDASLYSVPYKSSMNESGNDRMLKWSSPPQSGVGVMTVKSGEAPTFTGVASCQDSLSTMLTDEADSENRSKHKFLAKFNDDSFHWVSVGDTIKGGGIEVDDASITTNTAHGATESGVASIYGFAKATEGQVPHKGKDNVIEWKKPNGGCALAFYGWDGTAATGPYIVGSGATTNAVSFASATDSNVKVTCEKETKTVNGVQCEGVKITIGVYWAD